MSAFGPGLLLAALVPSAVSVGVWGRRAGGEDSKQTRTSYEPGGSQGPSSRGEPSGASADDVVVDVVYTWVDGSDPAFLGELRRAEERLDPRDDRTTQSNRFADHDQLRYSLRSLEKHAPWVRRVFIVTAGQQIPHWLDLKHPKVTLVSHREIFANLSHLPTFNSGAIEANLHRIPGLANRFLYFNDDFLLGRETRHEDFYTEERGFKIRLLEDKVPACEDKACADRLKEAERGDIGYTFKRTAYLASLVFVECLYCRAYGRAERRVPPHVPYYLDKRILERLAATFPREWDLTSSHVFRSPFDMQLSFSFVNFVMAEKTDVDFDFIFEKFDADRSGTWSDEEIAQLLSEVLLSSPRDWTVGLLMRQTEACSSVAQAELSALSKDLLTRACRPLVSQLLRHFPKSRPLYRHTVLPKIPGEITNVDLYPGVVKANADLERLKGNPGKFVCVNDNLDPSRRRSYRNITGQLRITLDSLFPTRSRFELPPGEERNSRCSLENCAVASGGKGNLVDRSVLDKNIVTISSKLFVIMILTFQQN